MNKERRKRVDELMEQLESIKGDIESILEDETEYKENIPENMQQSERYENAETNCDNLQLAMDSVEEAIECLGESQN